MARSASATPTHPTLSSLLNSDDKFRTFVMVSFMLHASLLLGFTVKSFLFPSKTIDISRSIRVDVVALPDKMVEAYEPAEQKSTSTKPTEPTKAKVKVPEPKKDTAKQLKESQQKALDKLKALEALEKIKQDVSQSQSKGKANTAKESTKPTQAPPFKGQVISSGNSFTGISKLRVNDYLESLTQRVRDHWELPQWLSDANLKAVVVVSVDTRGYVVRSEIHSSSGNSVFDASCLAAVKNASPFAPPPEEVHEALLLVRFPFE